MTISRSGTGTFQVSGSTNTLNLRWAKIYGRGTDDSITLNKHNIGGWAYLNMGAGNDTVTLASPGDYTLQLVGVETIKTNQASTTLTLRSDATTATDGSFTSITGGYGIQNITFTGASLNSTISLGDLSDKVTLGTVHWVYNKSGSTVIAYDLSSSYTVTLASDIETLNVASADVSTSGLTSAALVLPETGAVDISSLTLSGVDIVTFNSGGNNLTLTATQIADLATFTGGAGTDQVTLIAAASIDLTSTTTTSIESINGSSGADTIVDNGDAHAINGNADDDIITGAGGADTIDGGEGNDTFVYSGTAALLSSNAVIDLVDGGTGTADAIQLTGATTIAAADLLARITNVEKITAAATTGVISITATAAAGTFTGTSFTTIDLSGDTDSTGTNVVSLTGATGISTVTGSSGIDQITFGASATTATVTGGAGVDVFTLGANTITVAYSGSGDIAGNNTIGGFTIGTDKLAFAASYVTGSSAGTLAATDYMEVSAASNANAATEATNIATAINAVANKATANVIVLLDSDGGALALDATSIDAGVVASDLVGSGFVLAIEDDAALTTAKLYYDSDFNAAGITLVGTITLSADFALANISQSNFLIV